MRHDEIDEMLGNDVPPQHPGRWSGLDPDATRSLTGPFEGPRGDVFLQESGSARDKFSDDIAAEILSKTHGTRESGEDFLTAATRAVEHAVRTVAAEFRGPAQSARAIITGVLRGAGANEDTALKTLSLAASVVLREALLLGYGPTPWIDGVLSGAIDGARDLGLDRENAVSAATQGIRKGADDARGVPLGVTGGSLERTIQAALASLPHPPEDRRQDDHSNAGP